MSYGTPIDPKFFNLVIPHGTGYGSNTTTFTGTAVWLDLANLGPSDLSVKLNGDNQAVFTLSSGAVFSIPPHGAHVRSVAFSNTASGSSDTTVEIYSGVVQ